MGATKLMVIRHAEKPGQYNGINYGGVSKTADKCGADGAKDLITIGWGRAAGLVTLFVAPWGPKASLATPQFLYASNPTKTDDSAGDSSDAGPSKRPFETLDPLSEALGARGQAMAINSDYSKKHYKNMIEDALGKQGAVVICWQHEDIPLVTADLKAGISQCILTETGTPDGRFNVPRSWPTGPNGARYDLVWVFDRPSGEGPITGFSLFGQMLVAGDTAAPPL